MKLTAENVETIFKDCLYRNIEIVVGKPIPEPITVEGIVVDVAFHPEKIQVHKEAIIELLMELPATFQRNVGAGWSFLNACETKDRKQWGEHINVEQLFVLGMAIGKVEYVFPREMWPTLPGGMPYLVIL